MRIIREKSTNQVIFSGNDLTLTEDGATGDGWRASNTKPDLYEILDVPNIPQDFQGRHYTYNGADWVRTEIGLASAKEKALAKLAAYRYDKEVGGMDFNSINIPTDRFTQAKFESASRRAEKDPTFSTKWKTLDGTFTLVDATTIIAIGDAMFNHVQACYQREAELQLEIDIDPDVNITEGWPS